MTATTYIPTPDTREIPYRVGHAIDPHCCQHFAGLSADDVQYDCDEVDIYLVTERTVEDFDSFCDEGLEGSLKPGMILLRTILCNETIWYELTGAPAAGTEPEGFWEEFCWDCVREHAGNTDAGVLELARWGKLPKEMGEKEDGECCVLERQHFFGYYPVLLHGPFDSRAEAEKFISSSEEGTYYLSHNEMGRPEYLIFKR